MKKKTFKKAGVAVLSMAMLLSMGAVAATNVSAAVDTTTTKSYTLPSTSYNYTVYKVANAAVTADGDHYTYSVNTKDDTDDAGFDTIITNGTGANAGKILRSGTVIDSDMTSSAKQALATALAGVVENEDALMFSGSTSVAGGTSISLTAGYYLILSSNTDASPILVSVRSDTDGKALVEKSSTISVTKTIESIGTATNGYSGTVKTEKDKGNGGIGAPVQYKIETKTPTYDSTVAALSHSFMIEDIPETGIKITGDTIAVTVNGSPVAASEETYTLTKYGTGEDEGFLITFADDYVLTAANQGKTVAVTFDAVIDTDATTGTDSNDNTAYISYDNDYFTDGEPDNDPVTPGDNPLKPSDEPEDGEEPEHRGTDSSLTAIFTSELDVTKTFNGAASTDAAVQATFALYTYNTTTEAVGANPIGGAKTTTTTDNVLEFVGLAPGTYILRETNTPDGYIPMSDIIVTVADGATTFAGEFVLTSDEVSITSTRGVGSTAIDNPKEQTLPATGGIGTILFTVGGATIVLLAGAMFVLYMKKRKIEE